MTDSAQVLKRRALRLVQSPGHPLYLFSLTGKELLEIGEISRVSRDEAGQLIGYQRPEVKHHIQNIVDYLNGENALFPNSIILALSSRVRFHQSRGPAVDDGLAAAGTLEIPLPNGRQNKPAWIVDGQQCAVALSKCNNPNLIIPVNGFVADEVELQRDQFLRVNSAKPLPHGLITELLPEVGTTLPANLTARRIPSAICDWLNSEKTSPFFGLIRRASTSEEQKAKTVVADTSVVEMIEESLTSPAGCLFPYRNIATGETDFEGICKVLVDSFYDECGFDYGVSVDHIIGAFRPEVPQDAAGRGPGSRRLAETSGDNAAISPRLLATLPERKPRFEPIGVTQGWSPKSHARAATALQKMGYRTIAVGGLVPLKTAEILAVLEAVGEVRRPESNLHLFGVTRCEHLEQFASFGVVSFDSTSPLRQAFKDDRDNYHTPKRTYPAIRVPQVEGNQTLRRQIAAGEIDQKEARRLELACMDSLIKYDKGRASLPKVLDLLLAYELLVNGAKDYGDAYREILEEQPWKKCPCEICKRIGIHVMLFRGADEPPEGLP